jgi:hypothetical protein
MNFVYCYDEETKEELIRNNYDFMRETSYKGKKAFMFINNGNKLKFLENKIELSNRMYC